MRSQISSNDLLGDVRSQGVKKFGQAQPLRRHKVLDAGVLSEAKNGRQNNAAGVMSPQRFGACRSGGFRSTKFQFITNAY